MKERSSGGIGELDGLRGTISESVDFCNCFGDLASLTEELTLILEDRVGWTMGVLASLKSSIDWSIEPLISIPPALISSGE